SLGLYLILIGIGRLFTDYFRADASFYKQSWFGFFPNTLIAITAAIIGLAIVATSVVRSRESFDA
ncbi:MAG: hypothetical protein ABIR96_10610, partial [Bdellovibrionota bacterium]